MVYPINKLLAVLCCPDCKSDLEIGGKNNLICSQCRRLYPVDRDVPVIMPAKKPQLVHPTFFLRSITFGKHARYERPSHRFRGTLPYHLPSEIAALFEHGEDGWILDLGCGRGQNRAFFESRGYHYVGIDIRSGGPDVVCDAHVLPFKDRSFKAAVTFSTLEHLCNPFLAASEVYRVLAVNTKFAGEAAFLEVMHDNSYFGALGRVIGKAFDRIHQLMLIGSNLIRWILGKPSRSMTELLLPFAGSINWIAMKPNSRNASRVERS